MKVKHFLLGAASVALMLAVISRTPVAGLVGLNRQYLGVGGF